MVESSFVNSDINLMDTHFDGLQEKRTAEIFTLLCASHP